MYIYNITYIYTHPSWQKVPNCPILKRPTLHCLPPFLKFRLAPVYPVTFNLHTHCCFCCLVSLAEWEITPHLMLYFT